MKRGKAKRMDLEAKGRVSFKELESIMSCVGDRPRKTKTEK